MLAAPAFRATCSDQRLFPIGTLYDPFIARGLDSLNYACYQDARFLLVATPSGITLGPEGGAHQSINPPLIALGQPGLRHYEPAYADELAAMMEEAFRLIDDPARRKHLSPPVDPQRSRQVERADDGWREGALAGGYWLREPGAECRGGDRRNGRGDARSARRVGGIARRRSRPRPARSHLARPAPPRLDRGTGGALAGPAQAQPRRAVAVRACRPRAGLVTLADAAPASLSWLGGVLGQRVAPLGVEKFGQTGSLADLYAAYRLDGAAITEAVAEILLQNG